MRYLLWLILTVVVCATGRLLFVYPEWMHNSVSVSCVAVGAYLFLGFLSLTLMFAVDGCYDSEMAPGAFFGWPFFLLFFIVAAICWLAKILAGIK